MAQPNARWTYQRVARRIAELEQQNKPDRSVGERISMLREISRLRTQLDAMRGNRYVKVEK